MNKFTQNSPVAIRLGLRDLGNNKIATGVLILILTTVIGLLVPHLMSQRLAPWHSRVEALQQDAPYYVATAKQPEEYQVQAILDGYLSSKTPLLVFDTIPLKVLPVYEAYVEFPTLRHPHDGPSDLDDEYYSPPQASAWAATWSDPAYAAQVNNISGRLPQAEHEISVADTISNEHDHLDALLAGLNVGDSLTMLVNGKEETKTIVGTHNAPALSSELLFFSQTPSTAWTHSDPFMASSYLAVGPPLSEEQAQNLGRFLGREFSYTFSVGWSIRNFSESQELIRATAFDSPLTQNEIALSDSPNFGALSFLGILVLITLLSVPLYWQNYRRRAVQLAQLNRNGATETTLWLTRFTPGLVIGVSSGLLGFAVAILMYKKAPQIVAVYSDVPLTLGLTWVYGLVLCLIAGITPMLVASALPSLIHRFARTSHEVTGDPGEQEKQAEFSLVQRSLTVPLLTLGSGALLMFLSAQFLEFSDAIYGMVLALIPMIVGAYMLTARLVVKLTDRFEDKPLALRVAARELALQSGATINAVIAVALLTGIAATFTVIGRHHHSGDPYYDNTYFEFTLWVSSIVAVLVCCVVYFVCLRNSEEMRTGRSGLIHQGIDSKSLHAIDGYRALIITCLGNIIGYVTGTTIGSALMLYRAQSDNIAGFNSLASLPDATTAIAILGPILCAYSIGMLAGKRNEALLTETA